jgi:succinyl-CoA synthetase beta subunit
MDVARELYLSVVMDTSRRMPVIMASEAGGVDIEEVAARSPEKILKALREKNTTATTNIATSS